RSNRNDVRVFNMGVDYRGETGNPFWEEMGRKHPKQLVIIPFSSNKETVHFYWNSVGANCITGVYEPFGYTMCETLDRRVPAIVQDIDGPKEICELVMDSVFEYHVDKDFEKDIENFKEAVVRFWDTHPDDRASMTNHARTALDGFRPEVIKEEWKKVFLSVENRVQGKFSAEELERMNKRERGEQIYGYTKS
ncbi:MAG: hypothetical protein NZ692_05395, partial [Candidatus Marinimicrobia bacterium]|nr:hypothetical protein [Candidatus Neomarinimicrobiota bacterium]